VVPVGKSVETPEFFKNFQAWPEIEVIGIAQNQLVSDFFYFIVVDAFHRTIGTYRHESGCLDLSMGKGKDPESCIASSVLMCFRKYFLHSASM
jgi:hypothetical protein